MAIRGDQRGTNEVASATGFDAPSVAGIALGSSIGSQLLGGLLLLIGP